MGARIGARRSAPRTSCRAAGGNLPPALGRLLHDTHATPHTRGNHHASPTSDPHRARRPHHCARPRRRPGRARAGCRTDRRAAAAGADPGRRHRGPPHRGRRLRRRRAAHRAARHHRPGHRPVRRRLAGRHEQRGPQPQPARRTRRGGRQRRRRPARHRHLDRDPVGRRQHARVAGVGQQGPQGDHVRRLGRGRHGPGLEGSGPLRQPARRRRHAGGPRRRRPGLPVEARVRPQQDPREEDGPARRASSTTCSASTPRTPTSAAARSWCGSATSTTTVWKSCRDRVAGHLPRRHADADLPHPHRRARPRRDPPARDRRHPAGDVHDQLVQRVGVGVARTALLLDVNGSRKFATVRCTLGACENATDPVRVQAP